MAGITGRSERDAIKSRLSSLVNGHVYKTAVPDSKALTRDSAGRVLPYIVLRYSTPKMSTVGRNIASGEQGQPHMITFTLIVESGDADWTEDVMDNATTKLVGWQPSETSGVIQARGGFDYDDSDTSSKPTRFGSTMFGRFYINV